jgi:5-methylthioribose kinase
MREITPENAADYLRQAGRVPSGCAVEARELGWGVSNVVLRVDVAGSPPIVVKQARERLRVKMHWVSRIDRIWTERAAMELLGEVLPEGTVPRALFSDEPNYLFAMSCAPDDSVVWKEQLLAAMLDAGVARRAGEVLGTIHRATRGHAALDGVLADTEVFDQLRVDPYYRTVARAHPDLAPALDALIASMGEVAPSDRCLVLGDFSPKNILVHGQGQGLTLVDFETAHAGAPAFDLGFFLSHLWLKGVRAAFAGERGEAFLSRFDEFETLGRAFLESYTAAAGPGAIAAPDWPPFSERDGLRYVANTPSSRHLAACVLARVDGKSPVDYLDPTAQGVARSVARRALLPD